MHIDSQGWVSVAELIIFIPSFFLAFFVCARSSFQRSSGWIYIFLLCAIRVAGAVCQLLTYNHSSTDLLRATLILDTIGISPLLLGTVQLLLRMSNWLNKQPSAPPTRFNTRHFYLIHVVIVVGLILSIVGGLNTKLTSADPSIPGTSKVGIILYIAAYGAIVLVDFICLLKALTVGGEGKAIALAITVALPLLLIRLIYAALRVFLHNHTFNITGGSVGALVGMSVVEEFLVVLIYICLGFKLQWDDRRSNRASAVAMRPLMENDGRRQDRAAV